MSTPPPEDNPFAPPPPGSVPPPPPPPPPAYGGPQAPPPPSYGVPAPPPSGVPGPLPYGAPYGVPAYGYAAPENGQGTTALVTGILGLLCCGLLSIVAIVTGRRGMALADQGRATNRGAAQAGMILGWFGVGLWLLGVIVVIIGAATQSGSSVGAG